MDTTPDARAPAAPGGTANGTNERPPAGQTTLAARQHHAIQDLVRLSGNRAERTSAAHRQHHDTREDAVARHKRATTAAHETADAALADADAEHAQARAAAESDHAKALQHERARDARERADRLQQLEDARKKLRDRVNERAWLAEASAEAGGSFPRQEHERVKNAAKAQIDRLASAEADALRLAGPRVRRPNLQPDTESRARADADGKRDPAVVALALDELTARVEEADRAVRSLRGLTLHATVRAGLPIVIWLVATAAGSIYNLLRVGVDGSVDEIFLAAGLGSLPGLVGVGLLMLPYRWIAIWESTRKLRPLADASRAARLAAIKAVAAAAERRRRAEENLARQRDAEISAERRKHEDRLATAESRYHAVKAELDQKHQDALARLEARKESALADADAAHQAARAAAEDARTHALREAEQALAAARDAADQERDRALAAIERQTQETLDRIAADLRETQHAADDHCPAWDDARWDQFSPPPDAARAVRLGTIGPTAEDLARIDITARAASDDESADPAADTLDTTGPVLRVLERLLPPPAVIDGPGPADARGSLLLVAPEDARDHAIELLKDAALRLLTGTPAGKLRLTMIDPVGLGQAFSGFMRLADHDEKLVTGRIWTESRHIEQRLTDLTEHMETVIQKYLRTEYPSIADYNVAAGEIAEPYRYLVISEFPKGFTDEAARRLASILESGPRCGVYTLIHAIPGAKLPDTITRDKLEEGAVKLVWTEPDPASNGRGPRWTWDDDVLRDLDLAAEPWPGDDTAANLLETVGLASKDASRVEVPFSRLLPQPGEEWRASAADELAIPLGRAGATKIQHMTLGRGTSQHALIAGKTGSGKSTLLHVLITAAAQKYSPSELEYYLVDFKKGVEFKAYTARPDAKGRGRPGLPHARAVAIESDREFGLSVLERLDEEVKRRGDLFRDAGAQNIAAAREARPDAHLPRILLVIDEFQEFFTEDDKIGQDAALLLDRLVRQGRAFGIHVLLGSQTLSGAYTLARSTMSQMGVRIALQCSETDSYLILAEDNAAARLLSRPGEAIYNDSNGAIEGNNPFQVAWLPDQVRDEALATARDLGDERGVEPPEPQIVFEGNAPAHLARNHLLLAHLQSRRGSTRVEAPKAPTVWLGEPVAIKDPTGARLRRQAAHNLLILGQQEDTARALTAAALVGLAAQLRRVPVAGLPEPRIYLLDATPADDPEATALSDIASVLARHAGFPIKAGTPRDAARFLEDFEREQAQRDAAAESGVPGPGREAPPWYLILHGLHRLRSLRKPEDDYNFSFSDPDPDDAPPAKDPAAALDDLLRDGAPLGLHAIAWCDTYAGLTRAAGRRAIEHFELRALMQMSSTDSSAVIESPAAGRLGTGRMLLYDDERGTLEKFRPYRTITTTALNELFADART